MEKAVIVKRRWQVLGAALLFIMTGCSSSPEKQLTGEWKCEIDDKGSTSFNIKFETSNGSVTMSQGDRNIVASISKVDGKDVYLSSPEKNGEAIIRVRDSHSIELIDLGKPGLKNPVCKRMD